MQRDYLVVTRCSLTEQTQSVKLDDQVPELVLTLEEWLMRGEKNSSSVWPRLRTALCRMTVQSLHVLAKSVKARLTNAIGKGDIVERLLAFSRVGSLTVRKEEDEWSGLSYISEPINVELASLPPFANIRSWSKSLDCLKQFHFVNLFVYLVECRDKTFDQQSMRAFKSLKAYRFFADGYVKNMWLCQHPGSSLIVVRGYCHHSLTNEPALQVFVCLSSMTGDVYTAECNCVSGLGAACSHIAALLFALENAVSKGLTELPVELSKTSKPMEWNKPPKKHIFGMVHPSTFERFYHPKDKFDAVIRNPYSIKEAHLSSTGERNFLYQAFFWKGGCHSCMCQTQL